MLALRLLALAFALLAPGAGATKGFLDQLIRGHGHSQEQKENSKAGNIGRTVLGALKLALNLGTAAPAEQPSDPRAWQVFSQYDADASGSLTGVETSKLLSKLGFTETEVSQMRQEMDANGDGRVDFLEFKDYISVPAKDAPQQAAPTVAPVATPAPVQLEATTPAPEPQNVYVPPPLARAPPVALAREREFALPPPPPPQPEPAQPEPQRVAHVELRERRSAKGRHHSAPAPAPTPEPEPAMPEGIAGESIAPFGRADLAEELQQHASRTQDTLVDAMENAEVAEIKRAVFRTLTRLRAAEIKEFDTIARLETQSLDEYNDQHAYRRENPLAHLSDNEPSISADKYKSFH